MKRVKDLPIPQPNKVLTPKIYHFTVTDFARLRG